MKARLAGKTMVTAAPVIPAVSHTLLWANLLALALVLASAFGVIHSTHACRELYARLQVLEARQWHLQEDYGRLLLEESYFASNYRVEKEARSRLGMAEADLHYYRVLTP